MVRTQIQFTEEQIQGLRNLALREGISISEAVRRAVEAWVRSEPGPGQQEVRRRAIEAAGRFASGVHDVAKMHDEYLSEVFRS